MAALPGTVTGIVDAARGSLARRAVQADLRELDLASTCRPLSAVTYRHVPLIAYAQRLAPGTIHPEPDGATIVLPRSGRAVESLESASDSEPLLLAPPDGYRAHRADPRLGARRELLIAYLIVGRLFLRTVNVRVAEVFPGWETTTWITVPALRRLLDQRRQRHRAAGVALDERLLGAALLARRRHGRALRHALDQEPSQLRGLLDLALELVGEQDD